MDATHHAVTRLALAVALAFLVAVPRAAQADPLEELGRDLSVALKGESVKKVAVADFAGIDGSTTLFSRHVAEEIITAMAALADVDVIERSLLDKVLEEQAFQLSDLVDASTAQRVGALLGVDALVVGSYTDLDSEVRVRGRVVKVSTGRVVSSASTNVRKSSGVSSLLGRPIPGGSGSKGSAPARASGSPAASLPDVTLYATATGVDDTIEILLDGDLVATCTWASGDCSTSAEIPLGSRTRATITFRLTNYVYDDICLFGPCGKWSGQFAVQDASGARLWGDQVGCHSKDSCPGANTYGVKYEKTFEWRR